MADPLRERSYAFALRIVKLSEYLPAGTREFVISKKILDSSINIGLSIEEGRQGEDRIQLWQKYTLANKEAFKENFLLRLLSDGEYIGEPQARSPLNDCEELQKMLIAAVKTLGQSEHQT